MRTDEFVMRGQTASGETEILNFSGFKPGYAYKLTEFMILPALALGGAQPEVVGSITAGKFYGDVSVLQNLPLPGSDTPIHFNDNVKASFGNTISNPDLEIVHDTANSIIREKGTGSLYLQS